MAVHDVSFVIPDRPLGNANVEFKVHSDGYQLGRLLVSKGALVWYPGKGKKGYKVNWARFDALIKESGLKGDYT